jgi:signal transduction histidine kinase
LQQVQQAAAERDRLNLIFERASQVALALFDVLSRQLLVANQRFLALTDNAHQFGTHDLVGRTWDELAMGSLTQQADELWRQALATTSFIRIPEANITFPGVGQNGVWDVTLTPVAETHDSQQIRYILVSAVDISEQTAVRKELERLDRLKDEFLSAASHELRTPLTTLIGYSHILAEITNQPQKHGPGEIEKRVSQIATTIQTQLQRMNRLVEDIVDVTRLQSGTITLNPADVNLADVVERATQEAPMLGARQPVEIKASDEIIRVRADADRLHQVLINLLQNAITYAPASPQYSIRLRCVQDERTGQAWAQIEVQDWGPGIPREKQAAIFDRFFQVTVDNRRARKGLGLGLYIVRQIIEQHGGTVFVESEIGQGSNFIIRLPPLP